MTRSTNDGNYRRRKILEGRRSKHLVRIYERDKGICQICFKPCSREDASRDHIKEFRYCTKEEARDINNIRLAHKICNEQRSRVINIRGLTQSLADSMPIELLKQWTNLTYESD